MWKSVFRFSPPQSGRAMARIGLRMMPTFPSSPPKIPYGGFSPVRLQGWPIRWRPPSVALAQACSRHTRLLCRFASTLRMASHRSDSLGCCLRRRHSKEDEADGSQGTRYWDFDGMASRDRRRGLSSRTPLLCVGRWNQANSVRNQLRSAATNSAKFTDGSPARLAGRKILRKLLADNSFLLLGITLSKFDLGAHLYRDPSLRISAGMTYAIEIVSIARWLSAWRNAANAPCKWDLAASAKGVLR